MFDLPDYSELFEKHDAKQQDELEKLPRCSECGKPIQDEKCFRFDDELICENCLYENHRVWTEDYIE